MNSERLNKSNSERWESKIFGKMRALDLERLKHPRADMFAVVIVLLNGLQAA